MVFSHIISKNKKREEILTALIEIERVGKKR
jgi:hypothetical protein